jgi:ribosomal protein L11 methylase PrmA
MRQNSTLKVQIDCDTELEFYTTDEVFHPTGTSALLIEAFRNHVKGPGTVLDLGCGAGLVGIALNRLGLVSPPLFASDVSPSAIEVTKQNCKLHACEVHAKVGSLLKPWRGEKFDYVVNDVSAVAEEIAAVSPWFTNVPCASGIDGTELVIEVLKSAPAYLKDSGVLFFPVLSLSNANRILAAASESFLHVRRLIHKTWPLPKQMNEHLGLIRSLAKKGFIQIEEKFGIVIWHTDIYAATK